MLLILLLAFPLATGMLSLLSSKRVWLETLHLLGFTLTASTAAAIGLEVAEQQKLSALNGFLQADGLSALVIVVTAFVALVCTIYSIGFFRKELGQGRISERQLHRYYALTPLFVVAMLLVPLADNLGVMWVAIETTTLASVLLVTFYNQKTSFEAGWKYAIIGSVGIALALLGTVITYSSAISVLGENASQGMNWSALLKIADKFNPTQMRLAFILIVIGYGTKAGLAPMHTWKPDAYSEAPVPTATLLGAGFINCAIYAIMRFDVLAEKCLGHEFPSRMLIWFGVFSIVIAAPFILVQRNFRRLLAYSSIDHAGIMVAAVGFGGKLGAFAAVLHMLFHGVTKPLLFFSAGNIQQQFGSPFLRKIRGAIHTLPWTAVLFILGALAVTGTPPFSIFQSEFTALSAALQSDNAIAAFLFLCGVVTIFIGFLSHMVKMNLGDTSEESAKGVECCWKLSAMLIVCCSMVLLAFWLPHPLTRLLEQSRQILTGGS